MDNKGSVTVYIILIFSILIVFVTAVISVVRYEYEKMNSHINLDIAQESAFGKYYRPLLNDYGMYYYIAGNEEELNADIMSYVAKNQSGITELLSFTPVGLDITGRYYATDDDAANVKKQMRDVIKDTFVQEEIDKLIQKYRGISGLDTAKVLNECKEEVQTDVTEAKKEEKMLELLRLVEGISISNGKITCAKEYAKCALAGKVTSANAGIDNPDVWNAVKNNSYDMTEYLIKLNTNAGKAVNGEKVTYSKNDTANWCNKLKTVYDASVKARDVAKNIGKVNGGICNPGVIYNGLAANISMLERLMELNNINPPANINDWKSIYTKTSEYLEILKGYHIKDLIFDYSTLNLKPAENPATKTDGNISDMLTFLLGDKVEISNKSVSGAGVYENLNKNNSANIAAFDFSDVDNLTGILDKCASNAGINDSTNVLYTQIYIDRFFKDFMYGINKSEYISDVVGKENYHALDYEKEYIINAYANDRDNVKAVMYKIMLIRMGTSFVYLVTDNASRDKAYAAAAAVVGFTGLDAVVRCVQYMILAAWSYQDACVDTGILLSGKSIPILKKRNNLNVKFEELLMFSKAFVRQKIEGYAGEKGVSYNNYVDLFLLGTSMKKKIYRSMDIIQYNMKKNYDSLFSFQNAIYGADTRLICEKPFFYTCESSYCYR